MPEVFGQLREVRGALERHYNDMQDIEFTVQQASSICCDPCRQAHGAAALRIAAEMVAEGLIAEEHRDPAHRTPHRSTSCCIRPSTPAPSAM